MKYLIEGSCNGSLFAETVEADTHEEAERLAVERLCEAWGEEGDTLDDLGDCATVTPYQPQDYARDAAMDMLALIQQISRMKTQAEADGQDIGNDLAMDGLIVRSRALAAIATGMEV